jgi:hypothetical protein
VDSLGKIERYYGMHQSKTNSMFIGYKDMNTGRGTRARSLANKGKRAVMYISIQFTVCMAVKKQLASTLNTEGRKKFIPTTFGEM